jgi:hypothetical protein
MHKFETLAHEYGHFFDAKAMYDNITFKEIGMINDQLPISGRLFAKVASSSDQFLEAVRADKKHLSSIGYSKLAEAMRGKNASAGVQDAVDGLFAKSRIAWGHGEKYYNRRYSSVNTFKEYGETKTLQQIYKDLGMDASSQAKTKVICRQYEAASEMWANIMSAEVCGGESLEFVKKYLPNSYKALKEILKGTL